MKLLTCAAILGLAVCSSYAFLKRRWVLRGNMSDES